MKARDVMTAPVVTVTPFATVRDVAQLLLERRISGAPVMEGGRLAGVVSESDLLHRHEIGTEAPRPHRSWWARLSGRDPLPALYVKSHGMRVRDIMSHDVVCVRDEAPLRRVASVLGARGIRRVLVLQGHRLVGILTRADLMRAVGTRCPDGEPRRPSDNDDDIRTRLLDELERQPWWNRQWSAVDVHGGVVCYRGLVDSDAERQAARVAAENVPGVRGVVDDRIHSAGWSPML